MNIRRTTRLWLLASCLSISLLSVSAHGAGSVNLAATLNDAPAFVPIEWEVFRLDNNSSAGKANTHSVNMKLNAGNYRAVARYGNVVRERVFTVSSTGQVNVVIAMD